MYLLWLGLLVLVGVAMCQNRMRNDRRHGSQESRQARTTEELENTVSILTRQVMMQQFYNEERLRTEGNSGLKRIRLRDQGTRPYHATTHTMRGVAAIHDHANHERTVGMGELLAVLNGVEFRTRHNDYQLSQASKSSTDYHATDEIPYPEIPPEVLQYTTVEDQIEEMRTWFRAWRDQNTTLRDYRSYFKPVLCYLEGAWTVPTSDDVEEPFESDRHYLDATTWQELLDKVRFMSHTGKKDANENFAFLPTTIIDMEESSPMFAQWNYRILCHPLNGDLPLNRLRVVDEVAVRMAHGRTLEEHARSRASRFQLNPFDTDEFVDGRVNYGLLDKLMAEIPGKDNYPAYLLDDTFDEVAQEYIPRLVNGTYVDTPLNAAYYHRWYKSINKGAMGLTDRHRSFSDENVFLAMTTHREIAKYKTKACHRRQTCQIYEQRWTYAIPLEIVYLTPLHSWNPYDLPHRGYHKSDEGRTVRAGGRTGRLIPDKAYNGTNSKAYYRTPATFFSSGEVEVDPADTAKQRDVGVLDRAGNMHRLRASGTRIFLPDIPGVGTLRQRFPIMPVFGEGAPVWKELEALKDILLNPEAHAFMLRQPQEADGRSGEEDGGYLSEDGVSDEIPGVGRHLETGLTSSSPVGVHNLEAHAFMLRQPQEADGRSGEEEDGTYIAADGVSNEITGRGRRLETGLSRRSPIGEHTHFVNLSESEAAQLMNGTVSVVSSETNCHSHSMELECHNIHDGQCTRVKIKLCDGKKMCFDYHPRILTYIDPQVEE